MNCPCGSERAFQDCCELFLSGRELPATAEQLMRSRYTAFTRMDFDYIERTLAPEAREGFEVEEVRATAGKVIWKGLTILSTHKGGPEDRTGRVEFSALYQHEADTIEHHELSTFRKNEKGQWLFVDGETRTEKTGPAGTPVTRSSPKQGRNDPCACGSGKKFKKCCGG